MRRLTMMLAAWWIPTVAWAQLDSLAPGSRVRVEAPALFHGRAIGTIRENMRDSVMFETPVPGARRDMRGAVYRYVLTRGNVRLVELSRGPSRRRGAAQGAKIGVYAGLFMAAKFLPRADNLPSFVAQEFAGAVATGVVGAVIGQMFPIERWTPVHP